MEGSSKKEREHIDVDNNCRGVGGIRGLNGDKRKKLSETHKQKDDKNCYGTIQQWQTVVYYQRPKHLSQGRCQIFTSI